MLIYMYIFKKKSYNYIKIKVVFHQVNNYPKKWTTAWSKLDSLYGNMFWYSFNAIIWFNIESYGGRIFIYHMGQNFSIGFKNRQYGGR